VSYSQNIPEIRGSIGARKTDDELNELIIGERRLQYLDTKRSILRDLYPEILGENRLLELISVFQDMSVAYKTIVTRRTRWKTIKFRQYLC